MERRCDECDSLLNRKALANKRRFCSTRCRRKNQFDAALMDFWAKLRPLESGCWEWQGTVSPKGYGIGPRISSDTSRLVHRTAWALTQGPIPAGMLVCHKCDNPPCGNPQHLFLGTHHDNSQDMVAKGRAPSIRGERSAKAKVTDADLEEMRREYAKGGVSLNEIGGRYGITGGYAQRLIAGARRGNNAFGGSLGNQAKVRESAKLNMKRLFWDERISQTEIARRYGIHPATVSRIVRDAP